MDNASSPEASNKLSYPETERTVKHVCNDHLYNKIHYLWMI